MAKNTTKGDIRTVGLTADKTYDTRRCPTAILERAAEPLGQSFGPMPLCPHSQSDGMVSPGTHRDLTQRDPAGNAPSGTNALERVGWRPHPKSRRSPNEPPQALRQTDHVMRPRPADRHDPDQHRHHETLTGPETGRDRRLKPEGKEERTLAADEGRRSADRPQPHPQNFALPSVVIDAFGPHSSQNGEPSSGKEALLQARPSFSDTISPDYQGGGLRRAAANS